MTVSTDSRPWSWARWFWPAAVATLVLDLASKEAVFRLWAPGEHPLPLVRLAYNPGVAWSLFAGVPALVLAATLLLIPGLAWYWWRHHRGGRPDNLAFGLILGGAVGNAVDRVAAAFGLMGGVRDFIHVDCGVWPLDPWPTFNIADSGITIGFMLLVALSLRPSSGR